MEKEKDDYLIYREKAIEFAKAYKENVSDHIIDVMASVCMTRDNVRIGGSFAQAIVNNHLHEAISRADADCLKNLRIITLARFYCHSNWSPL
jgi:hypothetical protein